MTISRFRSEAGVSLVEMLVTIIILGFVAAGTFQAIRTTGQSDVYQQQLRAVMDDARNSLDRIRQEVREARLVGDASDADTLVFWVDANTNNIREAGETITYEVSVITPGRFQLVRTTNVTPAVPGQVVAKTLRNTDVFRYGETATLDADGDGVLDCPQGNDSDASCNRAIEQLVELQFVFDVQTDQGPGTFESATTVRLRNVGFRN